MGNEASTQLSAGTWQLCQALDPRDHPGRAAATLLGVLLAAEGSKALAGLLGSLRRRRELARRRQTKRAERRNVLKLLQAKLQATQNLEELKTTIGDLTLHELISRLKSGQVKPSEVLTVYQAKALEAHEKTNCLVEPLIEADRWAAEADISPQPPFYGLPVSIKDNVGVAGHDSTIGCAYFAIDPFEEDSVIVKVLKKQGAVPFMKTNIPQTMLSYDCANPIFGATLNPHDPSRAPGGSSGGEASLIASGGSLLGIGSDIGGSIRIPANMCGICGFKPTVGRLSDKGNRTPVGGQTVVRSAYGPLAHDVDSLVFFMKSMLVPSMFEDDQRVPPLPFDSQVFEEKRPLRIGYYCSDGFIQAVPAMERGVMEAKAALELAGHTLLPWTPPGVKEGKHYQFFFQSVTGDGGKFMLRLMENDEVTESIKLLLLGARYPQLAAWIMAPLFKLLGEKKLTETAKKLQGFKSVSEWWNHTFQVEDYQREVMDDWRAHKLDAVICPGFACPALPQGTAGDAIGAVSYTVLYNVLNFPAGSVPVTKVTDEDEAKMASYPDKEKWERTIKKGMVGSAGLPVNVQCVTLPWQEELCLRVMKELETATRK